jgi:hypothetical protein
MKPETDLPSVKEKPITGHCRRHSALGLATAILLREGMSTCPARPLSCIVSGLGTIGRHHGVLFSVQVHEVSPLDPVIPEHSDHPDRPQLFLADNRHSRLLIRATEGETLFRKHLHRRKDVWAWLWSSILEALLQSTM